MKKKLLIASLAIFAVMATGCKKVPKLENGEEVVAEVEGKQFTANELYTELKEQYGTNAIINMIDEFIVNQEIKDQSEALEYAKNYLTSMKAQYNAAGQDFTSALNNAGYATEDAFVEDVKFDYLKNQVAEKHIASNVTEDEMQKYYDAEIFGEITAKHILITPEVTDGMSDEEKTNAEAAALEKAKDLIKQLDDGADFDELAKANSDDTGSASNGGLIKGFKKSDVVEEFWNTSVALEDGKYTAEPVKSTYGYHVILRVSQAERPSLEDVKDDVIDAVVEQKFNNDSTLGDKAWKEIRNNYNLNIYETTFKNNYDATISALGN